MNSAAVIGRQLRQHQNTGRTSGPLVPPQPPYKGRPRTPSHIGQRPYSPAPPSLTGTGDNNVNTISSAYHYPSPHGNRQEKNKKKKKGDDDDEPRLKCTWHCFCVAFKALSGGIILLTVGTVMSVVGFVAESYIEYTDFGNGTVIPNIDEDTKMHLHNLTYAGPVIMGLGGIVVVAACVLTFEVRDTLGVKVAPIKAETTTISGKAAPTTTITTSSANTTRKNTVASIGSGLSLKQGAKSNLGILSSKADDEIGNVLGTGKNRVPPGSLTLPLAVLSDLNPSPASGYVFSKDQIQDTIQETTLSESGAVGGESSKGSSSKHKVSIKRRRYMPSDIFMPSPSSGTTLSHILSPNIESTYFGLPSPQETELSDPEGCSLTVPARWRNSRCSCSGSPTHSMSMELYLDDNDPPINIKIIEQQRLQQQVILQQQYLLQQQQLQLQRLLMEQQKGRQVLKKSKVFASIESDGLSSSSSSDEMFVPYKNKHKPSSVSTRNTFTSEFVVNVHQPSYGQEKNDPATPFLANSTLPTNISSISPRMPGCSRKSPLHDPSLDAPVTGASTPLPSMNTNCTDKRFPLLRQGALGNGSVLQNKS